MKYINTIKIGNLYFKKTVVKWTVSYISILLFISIVFSVVYYKMELILDENLSQYGVEWMNNRKSATDQMLRTFNKLTLELSYDKSIQEIGKYKEYHLQENRFSILSLQNRLKSYHLTNEHIESLFLYFPNSDYTISTAYNGKAENFFRIYFPQGNANYKQWLALITASRFNTLLALPYPDDEDKKDYIYVKPILTPDNEELYATVCIQVSPSAFSYENLGLNKDDIFFILDNQSRVLFSNAANAYTGQIVEMAANYGNSYVENRFDEYVLFQLLSEELPVKYMYLTNRDNLFSALKNFRSLVLIGMVIALLVGTVLTIYISNRNYLPIRNLIGYAKDSLKLPGQFVGNEFGQIRTILEEMVQKNQVLLKRNEINDLFLRNTKISDLLRRGNRTTAEILEMLLSLGISLRHDFFMVTLYIFDDLSEIFFEKKQHDSTENYSLAKLILTNILNERFADFCESYSLEIDGLLCIILSMEHPDRAKQVTQAITQTRQFVLDNFNIGFSGMISNTHQYVQNLPACYAEALYCIGHPNKDDNKILHYGELKLKEKTKYYYPLEQEIQILNCLSAGNRQRCAELINDVFEYNEAGKLLSTNMMKCLLYDMLGTLAKSERIDVDTIDKEFTVHMQDLSNPRMFKEGILKLFDNVCLMQHEQNAESCSIDKKAKDFIEANYNDSSLTVEQIARHIPVNKSYLSSLFKKETGIGIWDYITLLRIEEGKRLLTDTSKSMNEIITAIGYNSIPVFSRVFKKSVGVTPAKFRLLNSNFENTQ